MFNKEDLSFMKIALERAKSASDAGEVPIGCVITLKGRILSTGQNKIEEFCSAAAHAEILSINEAGKALGNWRLDGAVLYVSMEPCPMCWGAIRASRISRVVFAAKDTRKESGASEATEAAKPYVIVENGLLEEESAEILRSFFRKVRTEKGCSGVKSLL